MTASDRDDALERRLLALLPTVKDAKLTKAILDRAGVTCECFENLVELCGALRVGVGAVLLAEEAVTGAASGCLNRWLRDQPSWSDLPVLIMVRSGADSAAVAQAMDQLGNVIVLERPIRVPALVSVVRTALRGRQRQYLLRDQVIALREGEQRFRMLADNMSQLAWVCDELGSVTWYNRRWLEYTGRPFEEMAGWGWAQALHPEHRERVVAGVRRSARTGNVWEDTFPLCGADGSFRWFLSRAVPIRNERGDILRWFGTNTDITDQRGLEEALRDADRRKDEFLATLAHELRNPLAPLRNSVHALQLGGGRDPATDRIYEMMDRQLNLMVRLVDDLLEVSRITRGKIELRKEAVELSVMVRNAVETSRTLIEARGHELDISLPTEPMVLDGDPVRLAQVLANLLNNSAKYTERGGRISLTVRKAGRMANISVRDNGKGIEPAMLPRAFEMFAQLDHDTDGAQGGLGIGLSLVKSLVDLHGGRVEAQSDGLGKGSEFVVQLPLAHASEEPSAPPAVSPVTARTARRILVVDDNRDSAESLGLLCNLLGLDAQVAFSGADALQTMSTFKPAVVLLDIGMPGMDGHEVARRIRQEPEFLNVTLIALTGWGQEEDRRRSHETGFDHHLVKPPDFGMLQKLLMA